MGSGGGGDVPIQVLTSVQQPLYQISHLPNQILKWGMCVSRNDIFYSSKKTYNCSMCKGYIVLCVCVYTHARQHAHMHVYEVYMYVWCIWDICARVWLYNDTQRPNSNITAHLVFLRESHGTWSSLLHLVPLAGLAEPRLQWASCARVIGAWRMSTAIFKKTKPKHGAGIWTLILTLVQQVLITAEPPLPHQILVLSFFEEGGGVTISCTPGGPWTYYIEMNLYSWFSCLYFSSCWGYRGASPPPTLYIIF